MENQQQTLFKVRDLRKKDQFKIDDAYLNGYARICGENATLVYMSLCRHAEFNSQKAFPSQEKIAWEHGISKRSVIRGLKKLIEYKIVIVEKEYNKGKFANNIYILLDKSEWKPSDNKAYDKPSDKNRVTPTAYDASHSKDNKVLRITNIKDNKEDISKEIQKSASPYGNKDINFLIQFLKEANNLKKLDGSEKQNRRYCYLCLKNFGLDEVKRIISAGVEDKFHTNNLTNFRYLYYNAEKIKKVGNFEDDVEVPSYAKGWQK